MSRSTGPVLAMGAISWANVVIFSRDDERPPDLLAFSATVGVATGITAAMLYGAEKVSEPLAVGVAWLALLTSLLVRIRPNTPTPVERVLTWAS